MDPERELLCPIPERVQLGPMDPMREFLQLTRELLGLVDPERELMSPWDTERELLSAVDWVQWI